MGQMTVYFFYQLSPYGAHGVQNTKSCCVRLANRVFQD